jgi:non-specific serine/threonine protein kinase
MAVVQRAQGDFAAARAALDEGPTISRLLSNRAGIGHSLFRIGEVAEAEGDLDLARKSYLESVSTLDDSKDRWGIAQSLDALGRLAVTSGQAEHGARLLGAVEALCALTGAQILAGDDQRRALAGARRALGEEAFAAAWAEGRSLRLDQAIALARRA